MLSFVETKLFTRLVQEYLSDDEYAQPQQAIIVNPEVGSVTQLRWRAQDAMGRRRSWQARRGLRVIYFLRTRHGQIWMLTLYAKNVAEHLGSRSQTDQG